MFDLKCCNGQRRCKAYALAPSSNLQSCIMLVGRCSKCGKLLVGIEKIDYSGKKTLICKTRRDAYLLYEKNIHNIIYEIVDISIGKFGFYLNYSEYGKVKKCYSNLSTLKLGKFSNDIDLSNKNIIRFQNKNTNEFYNNKQSLCKKCF